MLKKDFPIFEIKNSEGVPLIYLDSAATSQKPQVVIDAITEYYEQYNANAGRGTHSLCTKCLEVYEETRTLVKTFLGVSSDAEIIFTKGTTEGINLVAQSWANPNLKKGDTILVTMMEHNSNYLPWQQLAKAKELNIKFIPITDEYQLDITAVDELLKGDVKLVAIPQISNVFGTHNDIAKISRKAHAIGAKVLVDGAQSSSHIPINLDDLECDFFVCSGHKMLAPTGTGILYVTNKMLESMNPYQFGGNMAHDVNSENAIWKEAPQKFESGTQNLAGVYGLGAAIRYLTEVGMAAIAEHSKEMVEYTERLLYDIKDIVLYTPSEASPGGIISFSIEGIHPAEVEKYLDENGIAVRAGSMCSHLSMERLGVSGVVRASFYLYNTKDDADALYDTLSKIHRQDNNTLYSTIKSNNCGCFSNPPNEAVHASERAFEKKTEEDIRERLPELNLLWRETKGDPDIKIAILDGTVDIFHPAFEGAKLKLIETLQSGQYESQHESKEHGTHVAGIILGQHKNKFWGLAPDCLGLLLPIFPESEGRIAPCSQLDLSRAIIQAMEAGANVINISGGQFSPSGQSDIFLKRAIEECVQNNVLVVAAAGNDGQNIHHIPASLPDVLAVGAMDSNDKAMEFSNWGELYRDHGILALGEKIPGPKPRREMTYRSGTSFATAIISGITALFLSIQKRRGEKPDPYKVKEVLLNSAVPCNSEKEGNCERFLTGKLNIGKAYGLLFDDTVKPRLVGKEERISRNQGGKEVSDLNEKKESMVAKTIAEESPMVEAAGAKEEVPEQLQGLDDPQKTTVMQNEGGECPSCGTPGILTPSVGGYLPQNTRQKVYSLGNLGYDFSTEAGRDAVQMNMDGNVYDADKMLIHLEANPWDAGAIVWTLSINTNPIYAILPSGTFARDGYELLIKFFKSQIKDGAERISLPGIIFGKTVLLSTGAAVPVVIPDIRGMYCWKTKELVKTICGNKPEKAEASEEYQNKLVGVQNMLDRIYHDLQNIGLSSRERALNFAATNAFNIEKVFMESRKKNMQLKYIGVEKSPICRGGSDCWDVKFTFWDPENQTGRANQLYRYTIDVSDVIPVPVGHIRSWNE